MQKGISFVGLMDLGTLDSLKKSTTEKIVSASLPQTEKKIDSSAPTSKRISETQDTAPSASSPLDLQPC